MKSPFVHRMVNCSELRAVNCGPLKLLATCSYGAAQLAAEHRLASRPDWRSSNSKRRSLFSHLKSVVCWLPHVRAGRRGPVRRRPYSITETDASDNTTAKARVRVPQRTRRFVLRVNRHRISDLYSVGRPRSWRRSVARSGASWSRPNYADAGYFQVALLVLKSEGRKREHGNPAKFKTKF